MKMVKRALETFEQSVPGDYDMILMDIQIPVMNGYEATKGQSAEAPMSWQRQFRLLP